MQLSETVISWRSDEDHAACSEIDREEGIRVDAKRVRKDPGKRERDASALGQPFLLFS